MATRNQGRWRRLNIQFLVPLILAAAHIFIGWSRLCLAAADGPSDARALVREHVEAGEFAPALQLAAQAANPKERDALRSMVAAAQASSGERSAAFNTASLIEDDRSRAAALRDMTGRRNGAPQGAQGGNQADFQSLIDLITSTIAPTTWDDVGGPGSVKEFATGVYVDAQGVLRKPAIVAKATGLESLRIKAATPSSHNDSRGRSALRKVSLSRLEKQVQLALAAGHLPADDMLLMAGLEKIQYVLVYPDSGDIVLAGPAGDWITSPEGRIVSRESGRPVLRLDDLVVILRHTLGSRDPRFGCSITPTQEGLARTKAFLEQSSQAPLKPGQRGAWLKELRAKLGRQNIEVGGIDPRTRAAQVLVEADYRMKLVGMGLEEGTLGVTSYLASIVLAKGEAPPPMDVLRWWFTMNYKPLRTTADRDAFELRGQAVQVLSENEMLTALGQRVHTGKSEMLNLQFARSFTEHFATLAKKYPVYADLENQFDLALVSALLKSEDLPERVGWHMTCLGPGGEYQVAVGEPPRTVESVINHRVIHEKYVIAGVSGGVRVEPAKYVSAEAIETDTYGKLCSQRTTVPKDLPPSAWWWD